MITFTVWLFIFDMGCPALPYVYGWWWNSTVSFASLSLRISTSVPSWWQWSSRTSTHVIELLCSKVYWPSMFADTDHWLSQCERCHIAKGDYTEPKTQQGNLTANQPLELLCIDFTKADGVERRTFLFLLMPFPNSAKLLLHQVKSH